MQNILKQIALPRLFFVVSVPLMIIGLVVADLLAVSEIYQDTHAETRREATLVQQIFNRQLNNLPRLKQPEDYAMWLGLDRFSHLQRLSISFIADNGQLLATNQTEIEAQPGTFSRLFAWLLNKEPDKILLIHPLDIDNRHIGELIIRNDLHRELELAAREAIRILLPWLLLFVLAGFALAQLLMALIHRLEPAVTGKGHEASAKHKMDWATALSFKKLTTRLVDAIDAIKQAMMLQGKKVVDVQEKERSKLANELHDELGQHLTAINFELDRLLQQDDPESLKATAAKLKQRSQRMSDILRSNLQLLRPPALDEYGLRYCLDELFNYWRLQHQDSVLDVQIEAELQDADAHIQLTAYRIVQECLTNISRHAGDVVKAKVSMTTENDWLVIEVADDGCGCQLEVVKGHYGLIGMRERVEALNGQFTVASQPGAGMQVSAMIPLVTEK